MKKQFIKCRKNFIAENNFFDAQTDALSQVSPENLLDHIKIGKKTVFMGGHFFIDLNNPQKVGKNAQITWETACRNASMLKNQGLDAQVCLLMNDMHIAPEDRIRIRKKFVLPKPFKKILKKFNLTEDNIIKFRSSSESPHFGKIHWEKHLVNRAEMVKGGFCNKFPRIAKELNGACQKGIAEFIKDLKEQETDTLVLVLPGCSIENGIKGVKITKEAFSEMNIFILFQTGNCVD